MKIKDQPGDPQFDYKDSTEYKGTSLFSEITHTTFMSLCLYVCAQVHNYIIT
jgi:hypothetical protein